MVALYQNQYPLVQQRFRDALTSSWLGGEKRWLCYRINDLAAVLAGINKPVQAARFNAAAQAFLELTHNQLDPVVQAEFDRAGDQWVEIFAQ